MIYLSGAINEKVCRRSDSGWMFTPMMGNRPDLDGTLWAADTGCFAQPEKFDGDQYLGWLSDRKDYREQCLFATAPDVVGDAEATMAKGLPFLPAIRRLGYLAALVGQDGLERLTVPWDEFDCLFIGGSTNWKLGQAAYELGLEADERGKWVHWGRVNSWRRLKLAAKLGVDSADGTFLAFGPDKNLPRLTAWLDTLRRTEAAELADGLFSPAALSASKAVAS